MSEPSVSPVAKLWTLVRGVFDGKRALVLLFVVGGATLGSHAFHGLLRPGPQTFPVVPAGGRGRQQSAASSDRAGAFTGSVASSKAAAGISPSASISRPVSLRRPFPQEATSSRGSLVQASGHHASLSLSIPSAVLPRRRGGDAQAAVAAASPALPTPGWGRPSPAPQGMAARLGVTAEPHPAALPGTAAIAAERAPSAGAAMDGLGGHRSLDPLTATESDHSGGVPCNDTTASLPSDRPPEQAWLPGRDASLQFHPVARAPVPAASIEPEVPQWAEGPSRTSLQATRITPCLPKQPAGRN